MRLKYVLWTWRRILLLRETTEIHLKVGNEMRMQNRRLGRRRRKRRVQKDALVPTTSSHGVAENILEGCASSVVVGLGNILTPMQPLCLDSVHSEAEAATALAGASSSPFFSEHIQSLGVWKDELASESEFEIEDFQCHWLETIETSVATSNFDDEKQRETIETSKTASDFDDEEQRETIETSVTASDFDDEERQETIETSVMVSGFDEEKQREANRISFEKLKSKEDPHWGSFFRRLPYKLEKGRRIAKGGQAEIYEALGTNEREDVRHLQHALQFKDGRYPEGKLRLVVKEFKNSFSLEGLESLQRSWPPGLASVALPHRYFARCCVGGKLNHPYGLCLPLGAQLLDNGRFAFIFDRYWGDFRTLIDRRIRKKNGAPPFSFIHTYKILRNIAEGMLMLHNHNLVHRDLKAANVLAPSEYQPAAYIADFESSFGIEGTGFWRAPEVLLALKDGSLKDETFTQKGDVYSYAMTCYEVLTGRIPFEGHPTNDYDLILRGERPPLPDAIDPFFKDLVRKCWHGDPSKRPSFQEIVAEFDRDSTSS